MEGIERTTPTTTTFPHPAPALPDPSKPWNHPSELEYVMRADWPQDTMITYLCQHVFSVPPRPAKGSSSAFVGIRVGLAEGGASPATPSTTMPSTNAGTSTGASTTTTTANAGANATTTSTSTTNATTTDTGASTKTRTVLLPKAYRVPLMFVAKFQWESLRLVLTSADPASEWDEFRFDIVHLSRLCRHLLEEAERAASTP